jgi:benzoyl-CoA reductase subunit B
LLSARLTCDCIQRVFALWAEAFDAPFLPLDNTGASQLPARWWELSRHRWQELYEPHRLDHMVGELKTLIAALKKISGQKFNAARLRALMEAVNQQEEYFEEVRALICAAPQTPVRMNEQVSNVMTCQWHRGSEWAVNHARAFRDEIKQRVAQGIAACPNERIRLMWIGAGLWHDTAFYTAFEDQFGAVFVWSMYLAFGPDGYLRYGLDESNEAPVRALASRVVSFNEQLHNPPWANEWMVHQAREHRIDGALLLMPLSSRPSMTGNYFIKHALEAAGIPVLEIWADMVDARSWEPDAMRQRVATFIAERVRR